MCVHACVNLHNAPASSYIHVCTHSCMFASMYVGMPVCVYACVLCNLPYMVHTYGFQAPRKR